MELVERVKHAFRMKDIPRELRGYFDPRVRIEIVDVTLPHKPDRNGKVEKITRLRDLGADMSFVWIGKKLDDPHDTRPVILGGAIGDEWWCVPARQKWLAERGIQATIDQTITLFLEDLKT
jgi:hypothetical protein